MVVSVSPVRHKHRKSRLSKVGGYERGVREMMHKEEMLYITVMFIGLPVLCFLVSMFAFEVGKIEASIEITNGERECITLPDERVECWEVAK